MTLQLRPTWAEINLDHFIHNLNAIRRDVSPDVKLCITLKADAYGHGAIQMAKTAEAWGADYLGVALIEEGIELRKSGIQTPILMYGPVVGPQAIQAAIDYQITFPVFQLDTIALIADLSIDEPVKVHLAVDSGMGRIGVRSADEALKIMEAAKDLPVIFEGIFTHFADADNDQDESYTIEQMSRFNQIIQSLDAAGYSFDIHHAANSAASLRFPQTHLNMIREGIEIYGCAPSQGLNGIRPLKKVMTLKSQIAHIKEIEVGETVSYGRNFTAERPTRVATLPIGYADGVPRLLSSSDVVSYQGQRLDILGRVNMDQMMVDVTNHPDIQKGDTLVIWGDPDKGETSVDEIAAIAQTIPYEVLCGITSRVTRLYKENSQITHSYNRF